MSKRDTEVALHFAKSHAESLLADAKAVVGLIRALEKAEGRLEYHLTRRMLVRHANGVKRDAGILVGHLPKPPTELPDSMIGDWKERLDEAWERQQYLDIMDIVLEARDAGPDARTRLAEKLEAGGVDLVELEALVGLDPYKEPETETEEETP